MRFVYSMPKKMMPSAAERAMSKIGWTRFFFIFTSESANTAALMHSDSQSMLPTLIRSGRVLAPKMLEM